MNDSIIVNKSEVIDNYKKLFLVFCFVFTIIMFSFLLIIDVVNEVGVNSIEIVNIKANPITDNDRLSVLDLEIENGSIMGVIPSKGFTVGTCANGEFHTDKKVCLDTAFNRAILDGDILATVYVKKENDNFKFIDNGKTAYYDGKSLKSGFIKEGKYNKFSELPVTGRSKDESLLDITIKCGSRDVNNDGILDYVDLMYLASIKGYKCASYTIDNKCGNVDSNTDGIIDELDLQDFNNNYYTIKSSCEI